MISTDQEILIKALTEVRKVKKCFDRAVNDNFFLLKPDELMVGYDQACMTKMINISVRIGSLNLVNDDVVEEIKNLLVISKADHIEDPESLEDKSENDSNRSKSRNRRHEEHSNGKAYSGKVLKNQ